MRPTSSHSDDVRSILGEMRDRAFGLVDAIAKLSRAELRRDGNAIAKLIGAGLVFFGLFTAGYCFVITGMFLALETWLPPWAALLVVGAVHAAVGALGVHGVIKRGRQLRPMHLSAAEIARSLAAIRSGSSDPASGLLPPSPPAI